MKAHTTLYENFRSTTLHLVSLVTIALAIFVLWMIFHDLEGYLAEFRSLETAAGWTLFFMAAGSAMLSCMIWLSGRYVLSIIQEGNCVRIKTWSILGLHKTKAYPVSILNACEFKTGKSNFLNSPVVIASWLKLKTPVGKTLVIDLDGKFSDPRKKTQAFK